MMKKILIVLIIVSTNHLFSQNAYLKDGTRYFENGKKLCEGKLYDPNIELKNLNVRTTKDFSLLKTGYWKFYYINGNLWFEGEFADGKPIGTFKFYYPSGEIYSNVRYENVELYNRSGIKFLANEELDYVDVEESTVFWENGEIAQKISCDIEYVKKSSNEFGFDEWTEKVISTDTIFNNESELTLPLENKGYTKGYARLKDTRILSESGGSSVLADGLRFIEDNYDKSIFNHPDRVFYEHFSLIYIPTSKWELFDENDKIYAKGDFSFINYSYNVWKEDNGYYNPSLTGSFSYLYPSGNVKQEREYLEKGYYCRYYFDANPSVLMSEGKIRGQERVGLWKDYFDNGSLKEEKIYDKGEISEFVSSFDKKGTQTLTNGNGTYYIYNSSGNITHKAEIKNGCRDGKATWYYPNGKIKNTLLYKFDENNKPFGLRWEAIEAYNPQGNPIEKGNLKNGKGIVYTYNDNGDFVRTTEYENGKITGLDELIGQYEGITISKSANSKKLFYKDKYVNKELSKLSKYKFKIRYDDGNTFIIEFFPEKDMMIVDDRVKYYRK